MIVKDLIEKLSEQNPNSKVMIPIEKGHTTLGGTPSVDVEYVTSGFDWDSGVVFIDPKEKKLTDMTMEEYKDHIRYRQLVGGLRGSAEINSLSDIFIRKSSVITFVKSLRERVDNGEFEVFDILSLMKYIEEERL